MFPPHQKKIKSSSTSQQPATVTGELCEHSTTRCLQQNELEVLSIPFESHTAALPGRCGQSAPNSPKVPHHLQSTHATRVLSPTGTCIYTQLLVQQHQVDVAQYHNFQIEWTYLTYSNRAGIRGWIGHFVEHVVQLYSTSQEILYVRVAMFLIHTKLS